MDSMDIARARACHRRRKAQRREQRETVRRHGLRAVRSADVRLLHGPIIETVLAYGKCLYEREDSFLEWMATL